MTQAVLDYASFLKNQNIPKSVIKQSKDIIDDAPEVLEELSSTEVSVVLVVPEPPQAVTATAIPAATNVAITFLFIKVSSFYFIPSGDLSCVFRFISLSYPLSLYQE